VEHLGKGCNKAHIDPLKSQGEEQEEEQQQRQQQQQQQQQ